MRIGIVVYSQTGNTRSVAAKLNEALSKAGQQVSLDEVKLAGERKGGDRTFTLGPLPELSRYDAVVLGAAVEAFSLSPVMATYLETIPTLEKKDIACLVTQGFPYGWMGGNRAVRQMRRLCEAKGGKVLGGEVVNWMGAGLEEWTARAVEKLAELF